MIPVGRRDEPGGGHIRLFRHDDPAGWFASIGGVARCGDVRQCPSCAAKVGEAQAVELDDALTRHIAAGGAAFLFTATIAAIDDEPVMLSTEAIEACWREMWTGGAVMTYKARHGVLGQVRSLEHTIRLDGTGDAHIHAVIFTDRQPDLVEFIGQALLRWEHVARLHDRTATVTHGLQVDAITLEGSGRCTFAAGYVTKGAAPWTPGHEMARQDVKQARRTGSFAPHELFDWFLDTGDLSARSAFQAYCHAMKGRATVRWSSGLRAKLDRFAARRIVPPIEIVSEEEPTMADVERARDQELAEGTVEGGVLVAQLDAS